LICADDYQGGETWFNGNGQVIQSMSTTQIDNPSDRVLLSEKGLNNSQDGWNYPWICDWQTQYIESIAVQPGNPAAGVTHDGDDSFNPTSPVYSPNIDTDCSATAGGAWECAAHPRYRYNYNSVFSFPDGHSKAIVRGGLKWFANIYVPRGDITKNSWVYGWYYPYEPY
jgi:hypothetical protein